MNRYLLKEVTPDLINGDVSNIIGSSAGDKPFGAADILFDWTSFEIPKGGAKLDSIVVHVMGEDGATAGEYDMVLYFAKTSTITLSPKGAANPIPPPYFITLLVSIEPMEPPSSKNGKTFEVGT